MEMRPHILKWTPIGPPSKDPVTGYTVPGVPGTTQQTPCRYVPVKGNPKEFTNESGQSTKQKGHIRVNVGANIPEIGQQVEVPGYFTGTIKDIYKGQLTWRLDV